MKTMLIYKKNMHGVLHFKLQMVVRASSIRLRAFKRFESSKMISRLLLSPRLSIYLYIDNNGKLSSIISNLQSHPFSTDLLKTGPTYRWQVVNPLQQTPEAQPVTQPETTLKNILVENVNPTQGSYMVTRSIPYFQEGLGSGNITGRHTKW